MMTKIKICYILATPVSLAALATAADTSFPTRGSNASGNTNSVVNSSSFIIFAITYAAATFISSLISLALTSSAPLNIPGKASTLFT